ncbi:MAG: acyl-CoA dehydrogenase [Bacillus thermozeamaize]|uniref:Acyl-CoA dehydrogenase n=1 Tax=Bacillus thermozeamaize TaxID=230954 RepID=A0A1Y3PEI6_9BACI|nr:MAG: acyl-CoA dehydrogenase [Bacillus thermozeamaize]
MSTQEKVKGASFLLEEISPEQVFTPEDITEEQKMIGRTVLEFVEKEIEPVREKLESLDYDLSIQLMRKAGELGLLGGEVPEEYGGLDLDKISATILSENMTRGGSFALTHGAHIGIGSLPIVLFGSPEQKQKYLPKLVTGELIAAYALTEPGSGSDALGAKTTAVLSADGKHYILNGSKQFITNGGFADIFIVYAKVDGEKFTAFIVERNFPGVTIGPEEKKMGIKGSSTCPVILEDVKVPVENVLGEIGKGHVIAFNILNIGRFKLGVGAVGTTKWAIELSAKYANERKQFNVPISRFRLIQQKLAEMNIAAYVNESTVYRTAGLIDQALQGLDSNAPDIGVVTGKRIEEYAIECSINKVFGSEIMDQVVDEAVQIHGGYGYIQEYKVEQMYRDSRINRIFEGTNEINRLLIPGTLVKKAMRGDLPLLSAIQNLQKELISYIPTPAEGLLGAEKTLIDAAKKITLMVAGLGVQKYQTKLEQEQELLANVADMIIAIYTMESAYLRTLKAIARDGEAAHQNKIDMTRVYVHEAFEQVERLARESLAAISEGDQLLTQLSILKKLARRNPANTIALKRAIAQRVIEAEKYVS